MRWSFQRDFVDYLNQSDSAQITAVVEQLEAHYALYGSWHGLQHRPRLWHEMTRPAGADEPLHDNFNRPPPVGGGFNAPFGERGPHPGPLGYPRSFPHNSEPNPPSLRATPHRNPGLNVGPRLTLFNGEQQRVIGRSPDFSQHNITALIEGGNVVGWLGIMPLRAPTQSRDIAFLQQHSGNLYLIATVALLIAAVVSLLLARRLLQPIRALAMGARALSEGDYESQVKVTSRDELGQLADDFNLLANTLAANESARRRWIADISHELRTPIAVLRGEVEALQDGVRPTDDKALHSLHSEVGS